MGSVNKSKTKSYSYPNIKKYILLILSISVCLNFLSVFYINIEKNKMKELFSDVVFWGIQQNLVELEMAIWYQNDHEWSNPYVVLEKLDVVLQTISIAEMIGKNTSAVSKKQEIILRDLYYFLNKLPKGSSFPNKNLIESEIEQFKALQKALRSAGWSSNTNYSSDWNSFYNSAKELLNSNHLYGK